VSGIEGDATVSALDRAGMARADLAPSPDQIGRYTLRRQLGAGGMGVVYAARDGELQRDVALKLVRPRGDAARTQARLQREAQAMARLSHRNVVPVFDLGTHGGQLYIAMELVAGDTLRAWVGQRPWRDVVRLFVRAGRGLAAAHAAGLIHRDFKPDNVIVGPDDEPRITDFGLARELGGGDDAGEPGEARLATVTVTGGVTGTPAYMAPEQLRGEPTDAAADQFSFCVALYEVLHGARPFAGDDRLAEIRAGRIARRGPRWLHAAIARGLAFDPARRWPSMAALVGALERGLGRRRWLYALPVVAVAAAGALLVRRPEPASCLAVVEGRDDAATLAACRDEFVRGRDPRVGLAYAQVLERTGRPGDARAIAEQLVASAVGGDALYTLGRIADDEDRRRDALRLFQLAADRHRADGAPGKAAGDLVARVRASDDVVGQLVDLDQAVTEAARGHDPVMEGYAHTSAARLFARIGLRGPAERALERAAPLMVRGRDAIQLAVERGNVAKELGDHARAAQALLRARAAAASNPQLALAAQLNAAYAFAEAGQLAEARAALAEAQTLDPGDRMPVTRRWLAAHVAARDGRLADAAAALDDAFARLDADDAAMAVVLEDERAELALARGDLGAAQAAARRAIARREPAGRPELRTWLVTEQRTSYELLFASLARAGDARGALIAFDRIQGLDVLAELVRASSASAAELARGVAAAERSALATAPSEQATLAPRALLALVVARGELWRITALDGALEIARIGSLAGGAPAALVPPALAGRALTVVLDPRLGALAPRFASATRAPRVAAFDCGGADAALGFAAFAPLCPRKE
jgi:tetratricopeptide (TPR) repeat protein